MRISDWSSDVCSSDLQSEEIPCQPDGSVPVIVAWSVDGVSVMGRLPIYLSPQMASRNPRLSLPENSRPNRTSHTASRKCKQVAHSRTDSSAPEIGRASCRERGGKYG